MTKSKKEIKKEKAIEATPVQEDPKIKGTASLEISFSDVLSALVDGYGAKDDKVSKKKFAELLSKLLKQKAAKHECSKRYNILVLYDYSTLIKSDADRIYQSIKTIEDKTKPLLLVLLSNGGEPGSAYLIGKLCRETTEEKFIAVIPRHAKSAATLLATAADEIHMGGMSELGPIDPQIENMPALGLKNSIEHIADLVTAHPKAADMFAKYLWYSVEPIQIGYYERAAKSAEQYAVRLLESHKKDLANTPAEIANKLVYEYKDHGFVIDKSEAEKIFGKSTIKTNTEEYELGNAIYEELSSVRKIADLLDYNFYFIGSLESEPQLHKKKK